MQDHRIISFQMLTNNDIYTIVDGGTNNGKYTNPNTDIIYHKLDFLCLSGSRIYRVQKVTHIQNGIQVGINFSIDEFVKYNNTKVQIIKFTYDKGELMVHIKYLNEEQGIVNLNQISNWVEPVVEKVKKSIKMSKVKKKDFFEELEEKIIDQYSEPIRLEKTKKSRTESLPEFLVNFFDSYNEERNTIYVDTKLLQTEKGKRRSLGDIFMICKYYYPECTLKQIVELLYITLPIAYEDSSFGFRTSYCNQINKRVWYISDSLDGGVYNNLNKDEYGNTYNEVKKLIEKEEFEFEFQD